ncbi:response regulator [Candidatus Berkelbacteria bacterium]|nr:response regulator [Candidatus Berkelbacteria bacterium]
MTTSPTQPLHILLVDDDIQLAQAMQQYLDLEGFEVTILNGGQEALDWLSANHKVDIVLLDIMMPRVDGFAVLESIRAKPDTKDIPVIVFTALSDQKTLERAKALNAHQILVKASTNPADIVGIVKDVLARSRQ